MLERERLIGKLYERLEELREHNLIEDSISSSIRGFIQEARVRVKIEDSKYFPKMKDASTQTRRQQRSRRNYEFDINQLEPSIVKIIKKNEEDLKYEKIEEYQDEVQPQQDSVSEVYDFSDSIDQNSEEDDDDQTEESEVSENQDDEEDSDPKDSDPEDSDPEQSDPDIRVKIEEQ